MDLPQFYCFSSSQSVAFICFTRFCWTLNNLSRNPIENRAISDFGGQKSGTRIILSILRSFLHFLKAKYINNCLKQHQKQCPLGTRENTFQSSENLCKHRQNFIISFISPLLSSVSYEVQHSFSTFGVAKNEFFFEKIFKRVVQKFAIRCK